MTQATSKQQSTSSCCATNFHCKYVYKKFSADMAERSI